jgi:hypothetical protein
MSRKSQCGGGGGAGAAAGVTLGVTPTTHDKKHTRARGQPRVRGA